MNYEVECKCTARCTCSWVASSDTRQGAFILGEWHLDHKGMRGHRVTVWRDNDE